MRTTHVLTAIVVAVLTGAAVVGCGGGDQAGGGSAGPAAHERTITVRMTDNVFEPARIEVSKGEKVTFRFVNDGTLVHEAYLGGEAEQEDHASEMATSSGEHAATSMGGDHAGMDMGERSMVTVKAGETGDLTHTFTGSDTVVIGCHQPGHWEAGMKATVTVG